MFIGAFRGIDETNNPALFFDHISGIIIIAIIMAGVSVAALVVFIVHVINNKSLPDNERIVWVLVFFFAGMIGFPIYWFMRGIKYDPSATHQGFRRNTR